MTDSEFVAGRVVGLGTWPFLQCTADGVGDQLKPLPATTSARRAVRWCEILRTGRFDVLRFGSVYPTLPRLR